MLKGEKAALDIYGTDWDTPDGTAVRDFIHVVDLAQGHIAALQASTIGKISVPFRTFNLGTGKGHSVREVIGRIQQASRKNIPIRETGRRAGDVGFCVAKVDRATRELGWKTKKNLDDCATDLWNFTAASIGKESCDSSEECLSANEKEEQLPPQTSDMSLIPEPQLQEEPSAIPFPKQDSPYTVETNGGALKLEPQVTIVGIGTPFYSLEELQPQEIMV